MKQHLYKAVLLLYLVVAVIMCTYQTDGVMGYKDLFTRFDEQIAVSNVNNILTSESNKHLAFNLISGKTVMYGRALFYFDALFSYLPYKIWGLSGQIIATRLAHTLALLFSFFIFIRLFIPKQKWLLRASIAFLFCIMPYTLYFCLVPKPEPYLLLFLALFLYFAQKHQFKKYQCFIFLGLAFGCKISVLAVIPFFTLVHWLNNNDKILKKITNTLVYSLIGFIICVPTVLLGFINKIYWQSYISHTFGTIKQEYDDISINIFTWLHYIGFEYFYIKVLIIPILLVGIIGAIYYIIKQKLITIESCLFITGLIVVLLVSYSTKRLWPHYFYFGLLFLILGIVSILANYIKSTYLTIILLAISLPEIIGQQVYYKEIINKEKMDFYVTAKKDCSQALTYLIDKKISPISIDNTCYLPYSIFTQHFGGKIFSNDKPKSPVHIDYIHNYTDQLYTNANAIIFYKKNPSTVNLAEVPNATPDEKKSLEVFNNFIPKNFHKDTSFGEAVLYIRN